MAHGHFLGGLSFLRAGARLGFTLSLTTVTPLHGGTYEVRMQATFHASERPGSVCQGRDVRGHMERSDAIMPVSVASKEWSCRTMIFSRIISRPMEKHRRIIHSRDSSSGALIRRGEVVIVLRRQVFA